MNGRVKDVLGPRRAVGVFVASASLLLAGCSDSDGTPGDDATGSGAAGTGGGSTSGGGDGGNASGGTSVGGGGSGAAGGAGDCVAPDRRCDQAFELPAGGESSVELRGNFAPDGWQHGVPLTKQGTSWKATLPVFWDVSI